MPTRLDFESTKDFRNDLINRTLKSPNGPQTFNENDYVVKRLSDHANVDGGDVEDARENKLSLAQNSNTYQPEEYFIVENINTLAQSGGMGLYPHFTLGNYNTLIGVLATSDYETESRLMRFAAWNIKSNSSGPVLSRIQQNLYSSTVGRVNLIDALEGNLTSAINIVTGREPIIESNPKITVPQGVVGKGVDFLATVSGVEFPWSIIPGDYLSDPKNPINNRPNAESELGRALQDTTGALGSMLGISRRPTTTRKPSDLFIEYLGPRQKSFLFDNLSYSRYAPDYTTTARSQNTSKVFNFLDNLSEGIKDVLGLEAPKGQSYIGDDRGNDVKYAMNDFNNRPVRSNYYLSFLFDPVQAELFQKKRNVSEGGQISGKLTWISTKSKNNLGENNDEYNTDRSQLEESLSTGYDFRRDSILGTTQELLETMPTDGGEARSHVANVIDQTSRIFREGGVMLSRGSAIKYVDKYRGVESGVEYCRVWTKDRPYMNNSDTMKRQGNIRLFESSVLSKPWNLNIYPNSNGKKEFGTSSTNMVRGDDGFYAKKYMFSIENLAWKSSNTPGFTYDSLPYCEKGSNRGRVMWFPPYDLKVSEQNSATWETNRFLGRPEPVYTYSHTERTGQVSFKVIVDHPSILNLMVSNHFVGMSDEEADNYINAFFAGCEEVDFFDMVRRYSTLTSDEVSLIKNYLNSNRDEGVVLENKSTLEPTMSDDAVVINEGKTNTIKTTLYFKNNYPTAYSGTLPNILYADVNKDNYQLLYESYSNGEDQYIDELNVGLDKLKTSSWGGDVRGDYEFLTGQQDVKIRPDDETFDNLFAEVNGKILVRFNLLRKNYITYSKGIEDIEDKLKMNQIKEIRVRMLSQASAIGDTDSNLYLSYRRSHSIIVDMIKRLAKNDFRESLINDFRWDVDSIDSQQNTVTVSLKKFGYESEGSFIVEYVKNVGEGVENDNVVFRSEELKKTTPSTFDYRSSEVEIIYVEQSVDEDTEDGLIRNVVVPVDTRKPSPSMDEMKRLIMKTLSECYYFKMLEEDSPVQFKSLREKLKYFHPAFHSMTPEGLNSRLTFLLQCVRPGDTLPIKGMSDESDLNARNTTFGPPPICVLRVGDFYHSKVIIRDVNIGYDDTVWDLNPEGIGVQPMIANVQLQVSFIGGHGLEKPVEQLQNALSSNFFANTEMYDPRSISTEDRTKLYKKVFSDDFMERLNDRSSGSPESLGKVEEENAMKGTYIGSQNDDTLGYDRWVNNLYDTTEKYFTTYESAFNEVYGAYDDRFSALLMGSNHRVINDYVIQTGSGTRTINFLGNYEKTNDSVRMKNNFRQAFVEKLRGEDIYVFFGLDNILPNPVLVKAEEILKPKVIELVDVEINNIRTDMMSGVISARNEMIKTLDRLNFIIENNGHDGKITNDGYVGVNFNGYTYDKLYDEYSKIVDYISENQPKMEVGLGAYTFFNPLSLGFSDVTYFLSVLLRNKVDAIMEIFEGDTIYTDRMKKNIRKKLINFMREQPERKRFNLGRFPKRRNSNPIEFTFVDEDYEFNENQKEQLRKTFKISKNDTTSSLNYYRP